MAIRLIATDLDGTLLRTDGTLSERTAVALCRAAQAGITVVPVTARPLRWLTGQPFLREVGHAVLTNGAVVYDRRAAKVTVRHVLEPATLAALCDRIGDAVPAAVFAVEIDDGLAMRHEPAFPLWTDLQLPGRSTAELAELVARPAAKLLVKALAADPEAVAARVAAAVGPAAEVSGWWHACAARDRTGTGRAGFGVPDGDGVLHGVVVELAAAGVTKASGLAAVASRLGVAPAEVVAFGDMPNDLPMLGWAGHAVAVANAHCDVLAIADEVVAGNDDDGVARWIMKRWPPARADRAVAGAVRPAPPPTAGSPVTTRPRGPVGTPGTGSAAPAVGIPAARAAPCGSAVSAVAGGADATAGEAGVRGVATGAV